MLKRYQGTFGYFFRLVDASVVVAAWLTSFWLRFEWGPIPPKGFPSFATYASLAPLIAVLWVGVFTWMRVYESRRLLGKVGELELVLKSHGIALLLFITLTYFFEEYRYSRLVLAYFGVLAALGLATFRLTLRSLLLNLRARGFNLRYVLAVGAGSTLESIIQRFERFPELGLRVTGVVVQSGDERSSVCGKPVLGSFQGILEIIQRARPDEVLIALPPSQLHEIDQLLTSLRDETLDIRLVQDVQQYVALGCTVEDFDGLPVVRLNDSPMIGLAAIAKRMTDVVLATIGLLLLAPLLILIGVLVKLTSPGPMLYAQERVGLDGQSFWMFKFRSMRIDAEAVSGPTWSSRGDDRRTAFGSFLRKTSLDELPQLWNVMRGEMSLVGPRPERPVFVSAFRKQIPNYMLRHKVRAGITGWAQVNGWRGNTSLDRRIEYDLFYIKNWSYALDLKILTMTIWKGFINKNAY